MFTTDKRFEAGVEIISLRDELSGTYIEVIPSWGGILHGYFVKIHNDLLNVIDSIDLIDGFIGIEASGFQGCKLSPFVCRLENGQYFFGGKKYKVVKYYQGKNALHGLLYDLPFEVVRLQAGDENASLEIKCEYNGSDPGYPFKYSCHVVYQLGKENKVEVTTKCLNKDVGLIPIQDGWHPYFSLGDKLDNLELEFQAKEMVVFDDQLIPTGVLKPYDDFNVLRFFGDTFFDNCFTLNLAECQPMCVLRNPAKKIEIQIMPDNSYPYLQFYTPSHRNSIAIENISSAPNAFNNDMGERVLEPGETAIFRTCYKVNNLP